LPRNHPYRRNQNPAHFNGKEELRTRPHPITTIDILRNAIEYQTWLGVRNTLGSRSDLSKVSGIKPHTTLYDLPYFEVHALLCNFFQVGP
jgi:hypothetical protein